MNKEAIKKQFKDFVKRKGLKFTSQRESILEEILNVKGHFEIEDMVKRIKEKNIPVSRATVYRTLNILKEMGLVNEVIKYKNKTIYEISLKQHHDHLICTKCGSIIEFSEEEIEKLQDKICKEYGFKPETHRLEIFGICKNCR
ncbi:MAG TPA: transcriptional repressor [Persephonella sp.]|nr:transcriptional repressor [Hydrogenothermaceae bacterium]HIQ24770.1 transcriptional repressor [Persephonella sp.]